MNALTFETVEWDHVYSLLLEIADRIKESEFKADVIVGISRGGLLPARILSDLLDNPHLANIKVEFYVDIDQTKEVPVITQPVSVSVKDKRVLIVDDITDSGQSFRLVWETLAQEAAEVKTVTIYHKPWSCFTPDIYARETEAWVIFPWEFRETTKKLGKRLLEEGKSMIEVEATLVDIGLKATLVRRFIQELYGNQEHD
jgi:hypoxanthine phosphoribosyltransferase